MHGSIPAPAVLASIPLLSLIDKLPSYFLRQDGDKKLSSPFDVLSWDTMDRKPSFRQFCQDMSDQFLALPTEHRLRDATGGSVRLAMAFLRPWFQKTVVWDFTMATDTTCTLAFIIAQWPAQWWSRDHVEMWSVTRSLVQAVAEEVREKQKKEVTDEVRRLQDVVTGLERVVKDYEDAECLYPDSETDIGSYTMVLPPSPPASDCGRSPRPRPITATLSAPVPSVTVPQVAAESDTDISQAEPEEKPSLSLETPATAPPTTAHHSKEIHREEQSSGPQPSEFEELQEARTPSFVETASCIITGILLGAFITLTLASSTRRTLIYVT